jgi:hypothetical protein
MSLIFIILTGCGFWRPQVNQNRTEIPDSKTTVTGTIPTKFEPSVMSTKKVYLIALEDNGKSGPVVGCGDSLVAVELQTNSVQETLQLLLDNHNQWYGQSGLYNALYPSNLSISRWEKIGDVLEIDLTGSLSLGGVCDNPRVKAQLAATIRQSTEEKPVVLIRMNGIPLDDYLSGK